MKTLKYTYLLIIGVIFLSSCSDFNSLNKATISKKLIGTWDLIAAELSPENRNSYREYWIITESNLMVYDDTNYNYPPDLFGPYEWDYKKPYVYINRDIVDKHEPQQDFVAAFEILSLDDDILVILDNGWWDYYSEPSIHRTKMTFMKRKGDINNSVWIYPHNDNW